MSLRFEVVGFAGAAPLQAACSAYVVAGDDATVLLDCGPGALGGLWRRGLVERLDAIVLSHMHADHVLDLVPFSSGAVRELLGLRRIALHLPAGDGPDRLARLDAAFARERRATTRFDEAFDVRPYRAGDRVEIGDLELTFTPTAHRQPCFAARVTDGEAAGEHGHMTAAQAGALAARAGARRLLLTHLLAGVPEGELREQAERAFRGPVDLAREGYAFLSRPA